jgi:D-arabinose 1-dehydrogenase-like Zn-dependent alcohol dehydrogenase
LFGTAHPDKGSFASHTVVNEFFAHRIPEAISLVHAGPLMCAGATVFEALNRYEVLPTECIGVIGLGGLGHLAIQYASKMGCDVVVFSGSESKRAEAAALGATDFYVTKDVDKIQMKGDKKIDRLIVTTSSAPNWDL